MQESTRFGVRWPGLATLAICAGVGWTHAQVTTRGDEVGRLLNLWFVEGSASGLSAITYENRDRGHSQVPTVEWPQIRVYAPTAEETRMGSTGGAALTVRPFPLIGNASMAAAADRGGSIPRLFQSSQAGFAFLTSQYLKNNLMVYPSHQDYREGANGVAGWGDLYPSNSSCVVTSLGSSYTDQPFLRAFLSAMAALPPATQQRLIHTRLLMPTLQALFRRSNKMVRSEDDYFTGRAHPPVFRSEDIDEEKLVRLAHNLTEFAIPPLPLLEVKAESPPPTPDRDFFELPIVKDEVLGNTPCVIARVFRGSAFRRQMTVSARRSVDVKNRELEFRWKLLQGDARRVQIEPSPDGLEAKITVAWHPEGRGASGITSHRVEIGVFACNGISWSAPSFITYYMLPNEDRHYAANGRLEEICYEKGNSHRGLPPSRDLRWLHLGRRLEPGDRSLGSTLLRQALAPEAAQVLRAAANELADRQESWRELNEDTKTKDRAENVLRELQDEVKRRVEAPLRDGGTAREAVEKALATLVGTPEFYTRQQDAVTAAAKLSSAMQDLVAARQRALNLRVLLEPVAGRVMLRRNPEELTAGDRAILADLHLALFSSVLFPEFLDRSSLPAFVDPRLTTAKSWRDVYRYAPDGSCTGWTRISHGREYDFDDAGRLLPEGRSGRAVEVRYLHDPGVGKLLFAPK